MTLMSKSRLHGLANYCGQAEVARRNDGCESPQPAPQVGVMLDIPNPNSPEHQSDDPPYAAYFLDGELVRQIWTPSRSPWVTVAIGSENTAKRYRFRRIPGEIYECAFNGGLRHSVYQATSRDRVRDDQEEW